MNKLKIEQNNNIEIVNTNTISKLYNVTKSIPEPKEDEEDKAYLSGNLQVNKSYRFQVDYLMNRFKDLNINVGNYYIEIEDPEVLRVLLANNIGDGIGVTTEEASTTAINQIFKNNTVIENFDEFKYFKGDYTLSNTFNGCINLKSVTIPSSANLISSYAFQDCSSLTSIIIPEGVREIGYSSFSNCTNFTNVEVPNSVTRIGESAFSGCSGLTSVTIPSSVTRIGSDAFLGCESLTKVIVPDIAAWCNISFGNSHADPLTYAKHIYSDVNTEITDLVIPSSVTRIYYPAFDGCSGLTSVTIPSSVTRIDYPAFKDCSGLKKVIVPDIAAWCKISFGYSYTNPLYYAKHIYSDENNEITDLVIPSSVTSIGDYAFEYCSGLTSITIPNSVTSIGYEAFYECTGLKSVTIPNSVTSIGDYAFRLCSGLTSIVVEKGNTRYDSHNNCNAIIETASNTLILGCKTTVIPNGVKNIGSWAFGSCTDLTSINIPNSVTSIGDNAFYGCSGLTSVTINSNSIISKTYSSRSNLKNIFGSQVKSYIIGDGVTSIGDYAFFGCSSLTSLTIGNSVTTIGEFAFWKCSGLSSVTIPNSVTSIGSSVFSDCSKLTTIIIGNNVINIGERAFAGTGIYSIEIPNSVISIGKDAFALSRNLVSLTVRSITPPSLGDSFVLSNLQLSIFVPAESVDTYKQAEGWSIYADKIQAIPND